MNMNGVMLIAMFLSPFAVFLLWAFVLWKDEREFRQSVSNDIWDGYSEEEKKTAYQELEGATAHSVTRQGD